MYIYIYFVLFCFVFCVCVCVTICIPPFFFFFVKKKKSWNNFLYQSSFYIPHTSHSDELNNSTPRQVRNRLEYLRVKDDVLLRYLLPLLKYNSEASTKSGEDFDSANGNGKKGSHNGNSGGGGGGGGGLNLCVKYEPYFNNPFERLTGVEFDGLQVLEIIPWENMVLTVPKTVRSLRITQMSKSSYQDKARQTRDLSRDLNRPADSENAKSKKPFHYNMKVDDWLVILSYCNRIEEICLYNLGCITKFRGLKCLHSLKNLTLKGKTTDFVLLKESIDALSHHSPLENVCLLDGDSNSIFNTAIDVSHIKQKFHRYADNLPSKSLSRILHLFLWKIVKPSNFLIFDNFCCCCCCCQILYFLFFFF
ncbi:hypothetical protein RFI_16691 [Reticulomyxa filosa]|uniref:Uncharacterized protein n=1 Tax=Reticulomyxa filosa TaxID=46433 RepID=X6N388_RETFI|nr:hypothetical protein RFI_16691 [Reticulomyxa filosa]|eukprot:ETO20526.1 hypothetical protein RFI_16691 [Reticulomyxa filosa]